MQLAYSTNAFTRFDLPESLRQIASLGFAGVEILCDRPHWFPGQVDRGALDEVKAILNETGLGVSNLNANTANGYYSPSPPENVFEPALTNPDEKLRRWRENYTIEAVRLARGVGAQCVSVTSGRPTSACEPERSIAYFVESLVRICGVAADYGVRIGIEYEPGLLVERASEALDVIRAVGSPVLGVNLDIGHSFLDGEPVEETVSALEGRIWNVHVEDIKDRKHFHRVPGDGELPFQRYLHALRGISYGGFLTVELYSYPDKPVEAGSRALAYLTALLGENP